MSKTCVKHKHLKGKVVWTKLSCGTEDRSKAPFNSGDTDLTEQQGSSSVTSKTCACVQKKERDLDENKPWFCLLHNKHTGISSVI